MNTEDMRKIIESAKVGDTLLVRPAGGRQATYKVRKVSGKKTRKLDLDGRRGTMWVLVVNAERVWLRDASASNDGSSHRRVMSVSLAEFAPAEEPPRSIAEVLRSMVIREAGLPPGYDIELHPLGRFQAARNGEPVYAVVESAWVAGCNAWRHHAEESERRAELAVLAKAILPPGYGTMTLDSPAGFVRYVAVLDQPSRPVVSPCTRTHAVEAVVDAWAHWMSKSEALAADRWQCIVSHAQADERLLLDLPRGYSIEPGEPGFYRACCRGWVGGVRTSTAEAVVDALVHAIEQLETAVGRHRTTAIDRDVAKGDASRCRRALRQIREIAKGLEPSGKELASGEMPEQVVAEVGHALRIESKKASTGGWRSPDRMLAWAAAGMPGLGPEAPLKLAGQ
jgi:hypothetical protein